MRVLHVVKTSDGGRWAALQAAQLVQRGVDVHVALPRAHGVCVDEWIRAGATLHIVNLDLPVGQPWRIRAACQRARALVDMVAPDIIHSHFVGTTMVLRIALGKQHQTPRVFQVPGPLHLEHGLYRHGELATAGPRDAWIGSSRAIVEHYRRAGIAPERLFLSYYGQTVDGFATERTGRLRAKLGIADDACVVGNINFMYPPKYHLGQRVGVKCHEDVIEALGLVLRKRPDVVGVLLGGPWAGATWYERKLRAQAWRTAGDRIKLPGYVAYSAAESVWPDFDCAVHVPLSENCGGVLEPLLAGVPTIASNVGGLPELVIDSVTGVLVPPRQPDRLAEAICDVLDRLPAHREMAARGRERARHLFDVQRTAAEVHGIYEQLLSPAHRSTKSSEPLTWAR